MQKKRAETFRRRVSARYAPRPVTNAAVQARLLGAHGPALNRNEQVAERGADGGSDSSPEPGLPADLQRPAHNEGDDEQDDGEHARSDHVGRHVDGDRSHRGDQPLQRRREQTRLFTARHDRGAEVVGAERIDDDAQKRGHQDSNKHLTHWYLPVARSPVLLSCDQRTIA